MKKHYAIGIDLGGTSIKYALIDNKGTFHFEGKIPSRADESADAVIHQLEVAVDDITEYAESYKIHIGGIGIGTPGIVDDTNRIIIGGAENIKGWENIRLADHMEARTGIVTSLGNDANLMGLGEVQFGAGKGATHVVFLTVGTGIGGAVVIDGKLFNGFANRGTELGHVPLIANGEECACGSVGCLEHYASTAALVRRFRQRITEAGISYPNEEINGELIVRLYKAGNKIATQSLDEHCDFLGHGIAGFINIFSPQRIVIGGGLSEAGEFYIRKVSEKAFRYAIPDCAVNTKIMAASLGNKAGCIGAASLIFSDWED
ncbi:ROK family protein [Bacteroides sp.]|uniref:ROK family protein n=1 Tax=Bacteroides sp. TaxID=29523 RepID=UPI002620AF70|nr:ROK family protein [Bacteroides sp.]MDD3037400.1 ROK family protein [Bacteroides sp.]